MVRPYTHFSAGHLAIYVSKLPSLWCHKFHLFSSKNNITIFVFFNDSRIKGIFMGDLIEGVESDDRREQVVLVGNENSKVSLKVYQDVYHQVNGRTEEYKKRYSDNILLEFSDLEQLHYKISQLCDVHNVIANTEVISVFHDKDRKEQFTSFERFRLYNSNAASPTVNVVFKYNFSIIPAGLERPQEYVVTIRLVSRVAMLKQMEEDAPTFMHSRLLGYLGGITAEITIEYADYVIARGFSEAFDEWIRGCNSTPKKKWLSALQKRSHLIPQNIALIAMILIGYFSLGQVSNYFYEGAGLEKAARFFIVYSSAAFIIITLSKLTGRSIELSIDSFPMTSYLRLNNGDKNLINDFSEKKKAVIKNFIVSCLVTICLGVLASKLERLI